MSRSSFNQITKVTREANVLAFSESWLTLEKVSGRSGWSGTVHTEDRSHSLTQTESKFMAILLHPNPKCWSYRCVPPGPAPNFICLHIPIHLICYVSSLTTTGMVTLSPVQTLPWAWEHLCMLNGSVGPSNLEKSFHTVVSSTSNHHPSFA